MTTTALGLRFLILCITVAGCRDAIYRTYGFDSGEAMLPDGTKVQLTLQGTSRYTDSAGRIVDVTGSPYWIGIYIDMPRRAKLRLVGLALTGLESGRSYTPDLSSPQPV